MEETRKYFDYELAYEGYMRAKELLENGGIQSLEEEFEVAVREEILYDLVYYNGNCLYNQMENDLCNYETDYVAFQDASKELERKVQKYFKDFKLKRYDENGNLL